ncbi:MAG: hypothetical protein AVDCRST_MAG76-504 [uncultured Acidimicrobiales bacterium]|uniref:DUF3153 domain-containing protein n=1 Tax=uncultured Acidimicrobiales bacterium TaxID=310071 RepID=A0A6J4HCP4_9ACTN|nr:MAG: hypothetical protein AVDCRST_MAG76-504 [uncultured Acidimicrobiales bacterium]
MRLPRLAPLILVALLVVLAGACRVDVEVGIDARADGSGQVRVEVDVDREVAAAVDLSKGVRVDDLRQAGWRIEGPTARPDGGVAVVASKPFRDEAGAQLAIEELTGPDGPFQAFRLERERTFARTTTRFAGTVDFAKGIEAFGDPGVRQALGGSDIGIDLTRLEQALNGPVDRAVGIHVAVRLPGEVESNAPAQTENGARWELRLRDRVDLTAESAAWNTSNLVGATVAVLAALGLVVLLLTRRGS